MATGPIKRGLTFKTMSISLPKGTTEIAVPNTGFAFLLFSNTQQAIYGISGANANLLCGNIPNNASVSFENSTLTVTNPNTWNARLFVIC